MKKKKPKVKPLIPLGPEQLAQHMGWHYCRPSGHMGQGGYDHLVSACVEDQMGHFWLIGTTGRLSSAVRFCPFCGQQCLSEPEAPSQPTVATIADDPKTGLAPKHNRHWVTMPGVVMEHKQWGLVKVYGTDYNHAKVRHDRFPGFVTVCWENLAKPEVIGERPATKEPKEKKAKKVSEVVSKYLNFGLNQEKKIEQ